MKKKPKAISPKTGRRGRKPGDGVLQKLGHQANTDNQAESYRRGLVFHYGKAAADCPAAFALAKQWDFYRKMAIHVELEKIRIGAARIAAARKRKKPGVDLEAGRCCFLERELESDLPTLLTATTKTLTPVLFNGDAEFFRKLADAIESLRDNAKSPVYRLHSAISLFAFACTRLTIGKLCEQLEIHWQKLRPQGQTDESWRRRVRTACKEVGFTLLPDKPGPKRKRS